MSRIRAKSIYGNHKIYGWGTLWYFETPELPFDFWPDYGQMTVMQKNRFERSHAITQENPSINIIEAYKYTELDDLGFGV